MAKHCNWSVNADLRIRLDLSGEAQYILEQDKATFHAASRTQLLNRIFLNTHIRSDASIARCLEAEQDRCKALLEKLRLPAATLQDVTKTLLQEKEAALTAKHQYERSYTTISHNLSEEAADALLNASREQKYYTVPGYFKAVIEDYCRQSFSRREELYFAEFFQAISGAIAHGKQLNIRTQGKVSYLVNPYEILLDPQGRYHYLACYARPQRQKDTEKTCHSFRINQLLSVTETDMPAVISREEARALEEAIHSRGVQFLVGRCKTVKVRLTPRGEQKLYRYATLRPTFTDRTPEGVYTFLCTEAQAEYYFPKLGADAEILAPARLRTRFAHAYAQAAALYAPKPDGEPL